ncbi:MAG: hypothetical protein ABI609_00515 [Acidobacteriota bacterium]
MRHLAALVLLGFFGVCTQGAFGDTYAVKFVASKNPANNGEYRIAEVEASLTPKDGVVGLFRNHDDVGLLNGWVTFLYSAHAFGADGKELRLTYLTGGRFRVEGWSSGPVTLKYRVLLQHDRFPNDPGYDELAYARPYGVFWTGRALLMEGAPATDIDVRFDAPADWTISTPWASADLSGRHFIALTTDDLLDSALMAGTQITKVLQVAGGEARLALAPPIAALENPLVTTLNSSLRAYESMFGVAMKGRLLVIAADAPFSGGGVMGRSISMLLGHDRGDMKAQGEYVIAHEAFHVWNGQWRENDPDGELQWLGEGSADYYANLVRVREGLLAEDEFIAELGHRATLYLNALRQRSIAGGGSTKLNGGEDSYNIVYSGGMLADLVLDAMLRQRSHGRETLDEVMRVLHARYAGEGRETATTKDLASLLADRFALPANFLARYVSGRELLPLHEAFAAYGLDMRVEDSAGAVTVTVSKSARASARQKTELRRWLDAPQLPTSGSTNAPQP